MKFPKLPAFKNRKKVAAVAATGALAAVLLAGGAYALFSGSVNTPGRVEAGSVQVGLSRTAFSSYVLNEEGVMETVEDKTALDLTGDEACLFDIRNAVPTSRYEATVAVSNAGTAGFDYRMYIDWDAAAADERMIALSEQLEITVSGADRTAPVTFRLSEAPAAGVDLGTLLVGDAAETFTVTATFVDCEDNNAAAGASLAFDVQVSAVQRTIQAAE